MRMGDQEVSSSNLGGGLFRPYTLPFLFPPLFTHPHRQHHVLISSISGPIRFPPTILCLHYTRYVSFSNTISIQYHHRSVLSFIYIRFCLFIQHISQSIVLMNIHVDKFGYVYRCVYVHPLNAHTAVRPTIVQNAVHPMIVRTAVHIPKSGKCHIWVMSVQS